MNRKNKIEMEKLKNQEFFIIAMVILAVAFCLYQIYTLLIYLHI